MTKEPADAMATIRQLRARVEQLEQALQPFADAADECDDMDADDFQQAPVEACQCRTARAVLEGNT